MALHLMVYLSSIVSHEGTIGMAHEVDRTKTRQEVIPDIFGLDSHFDRVTAKRDIFLHGR